MIPGAGRRRWSAHRFARGGGVGGGRLRAVRRLLACSLAAVRRSLSAAAASHPQPVHSRGRKFAPTRTSALGKGYGLKLVFVINVWLLRIREHCSNASRRRLCSSMLERQAAWRCRARVRYRGYRGSAMVISGKVGVRGGQSVVQNAKPRSQKVRCVESDLRMRFAASGSARSWHGNS